MRTARRAPLASTRAKRWRRARKLVAAPPSPKRLQDTRQEPLHSSRHPVQTGHEIVGDVAGIAGEALIPAVAVESHGHVTRGHLGEVEAGDRRGIGEGFAVVPCQLGHDLDGVRLYDELVVIGGEVLGDRAGVADLVELGVGKPDREGLHGLAHLVGHRGDHRA